MATTRGILWRCFSASKRLRPSRTTNTLTLLSGCARRRPSSCAFRFTRAVSLAVATTVPTKSSRRKTCSVLHFWKTRRRRGASDFRMMKSVTSYDAARHSAWSVRFAQWTALKKHWKKLRTLYRAEYTVKLGQVVTRQLMPLCSPKPSHAPRSALHARRALPCSRARRRTSTVKTSTLKWRRYVPGIVAIAHTAFGVTIRVAPITT